MTPIRTTRIALMLAHQTIRRLRFKHHDNCSEIRETLSAIDEALAGLEVMIALERLEGRHDVIVPKGNT